MRDTSMASLQPRGSPTAASSFSREPAPSCTDRVGVDPSRVLMQADSAKDGKWRRRHRGDDDSRASKKQRVASPVAHLSCARIRPFVHASRPKQQTQVSAPAVRRDAQAAAITKQNTVGSISCKNIEPAVPASQPRVAVQPSGLKVKDKLKVPYAGVLRNDRVIKTKQEAGKRVQASATTTIPPLSHPTSAMKVRSAGVVRNDGVVKTKQEAGKRVQATATTSIPPLSHSASVMKVRSAGVVRKEAHGVIKTKQEASRSVQSTLTKSIPHPAPAGNHQDPHALQDALRAALAAAHQARERRQQNVYREQREQARRELDKVVRTVFFNDPYLTLENAFKH
ncbi:hypothetical protein ACQ4PT_021717 [Festuca glaucescens]